MNKKKLINFEHKVVNLFNNAKIRAPVHLHSNNENFLISYFKKNISKNDWVFSSWRSHYHCLLKGIPEKKIMQEILNGKSISLCFPEYKFYSSAIVGGILPIAVGVAISIKKQKKKNKVFCFIGEMTSETGIAHETIKYSLNKKLPIKFIIENNFKSVCTDTKKTWGLSKFTYELKKLKNVTFYNYKLDYPHAGAGKRVQF